MTRQDPRPALPQRPALVRPRSPLRDSLTVAIGGVLMALAMIYGCSGESSPRPPPGGGDCTGHCGAIVASGGSQVSTGGVASDDDGGGGGTFADVNPPAFDGNLAPPM
jgi:hypothetical protein